MPIRYRRPDAITVFTTLSNSSSALSCKKRMICLNAFVMLFFVRSPHGRSQYQSAGFVGKGDGGRVFLEPNMNLFGRDCLEEALRADAVLPRGAAAFRALWRGAWRQQRR